jgi:hypothetical protein
MVALEECAAELAQERESFWIIDRIAVGEADLNVALPGRVERV